MQCYFSECADGYPDYVCPKIVGRNIKKQCKSVVHQRMCPKTCEDFCNQPCEELAKKATQDCKPDE